MPKSYEFLSSFAQQRLWPLLTCSLLLFVAGTFLWYSPDSSEIYFKNYTIHRALRTLAQDENAGGQIDPTREFRDIQIPWWQFDLAPGDILRMPLKLPAKTPDGQWFIEVLGHPIDARSGGAISVNGHRLEVDASQGPRWQRIHLDARPGAGNGSFALRYHAAEAGARFRLWGSYFKPARGRPGHRPTLVSEGRESALSIPEPLPFRRGNLAPVHERLWRKAYRVSSVDPFFRVGVRTRLVSSKWIGDKLILISVGLLAGILLLSFAAFAIRHPASALAVVAISLAALWLRWSAIGSLAEQYERTAHGLTVRHNLWWDSAAYFWIAFKIFSNETPTALSYPIGMPTFSSYLFRWNGIDLLLPKYGFALLQTMVGPALFFACRRVVRFEVLAFLPLLLWSGFLRPVKYSYYYLSESTAMFLMIAWVAILISRDPRVRDPNWRWVVVSSSIVFVLSSYSRDIIITFLPAFLGMIWIFAGGRPSHRLTSAASALAVVVALWCASPLLFSNKSFSLSPVEFLAITPDHYETAQGAKGAREERVSIFATLGGALGQLLDRPGTYLGDLYSDGERVWSPHYRWANFADYVPRAVVKEQRMRETRSPSLYSLGEPNVRAAYEKSVPARYLLSDNPGGNYARLLMLAAATAVFGLIFSQRWRVLAGFLLYATLFQTVLFRDFSARPRATFFPVIVLFASLGVFATVEQFPAWLRARRSRGLHFFVKSR